MATKYPWKVHWKMFRKDKKYHRDSALFKTFNRAKRFRDHLLSDEPNCLEALLVENK